MDLMHLIQALSDPAAYLGPVEKVQVHQTHISVVFLAGEYAYKIKKPVDLGFLDFRTLEKRHHYCSEEVRLNRRLAPSVYVGVVPVTRVGTKVAMGGEGEIVEWAVQMERLPNEATLLSRLSRGDISAELVEALACKVAAFHAHAERGEHISGFGRFETVARNVRENYDQSAAQIGNTLSEAVYERLRSLTETALTRLRPPIEQRADRGVPRDTHGDLHLDHVYLFPERRPPNDLIVIDCIEFNERFRYADPIADMAFLVMDLTFHGRADLTRAFADAYFRASGDDEGRLLLPFYTAYRAAIRGKVEGFELGEKEIPEAERTAAQTRAKAHWLLALGELEEPNRKPCLVLVGGHPGAGKSTLARGLVEAVGFSLIRSDVVRKELAGRFTEGSAPMSPLFEEDIYTPEWNERTYSECLRRVETLLVEGKRVLVDASFREENRRRTFLDTAIRWGVPGLFLVCRADENTVQARLRERRNDASDADWSIYQWSAKVWQQPSLQTVQRMWVISTGGSREQAVSQSLGVLRGLHLHE